MLTISWGWRICTTCIKATLVSIGFVFGRTWEMFDCQGQFIMVMQNGEDKKVQL